MQNPQPIVPPADEEWEELVSLYGGIYVPSEQEEEAILECLCADRAAKDAS